jgi:hypothetical protein
MDEQDRRDFLKTVAIGGAALLAAPRLCVAAETEDDKKIFSQHFRVEVKGMYGEVPGVVRIDPGRVAVAIEETTQGDQPEHRTYSYGDHAYEALTMTVQQSPGMIKLQSWAAATKKIGGKAAAPRRDISIYLLARNKSTVLRIINCFGCYPVNFRAGSHGTASDIKTITLTCNVDRIEVA